MGLLTAYIKPHHRAAAAKALGKDLPTGGTDDQPI